MIPFDDHLATPTYLTAMQACEELKWEEAVRLFEQEPENSSCYGLALGNKGQALLNLDRYREAEVSLQQSLELPAVETCPHAPSQVQFRRNLAEAIGRQGRWAESFSLFGEAVGHADVLLERYPQEQKALLFQKAHIFNAWGNSYLKLERWQQATEQYEKARTIYQLLPAVEREGYAETLTNISLALQYQDLLRAELAAKEALDVATASGDEDQVFRIKIAAIRMRSSLVQAEDHESTLMAAAEHSKRLGRFATAYLRFCIGAENAENANAWEEGLRFVERAKEIESSLHHLDPHIAMLRGTEALLLRLANTPDERILPVLIDGARLWYQRLAQPIIPTDFDEIARSMHNHFRMLTHHLLSLDRVEEALAAFEAGRSLMHYRKMAPAFMDDVIRQNPFAQANDRVSVESLRKASQTLRDGECAVVLAVVPPELVAFVVWSDQVKVVVRQWPVTLDEGDALLQETEMIPHRLAEMVGKRAIPSLYRKCARAIVGIVGSSCIRSLTPYSILHRVPWRVLLHDAGLPWPQMSFSTGFGFLLRIVMPPSLSLSERQAVALGHGMAGNIDLAEEARRFAMAFGVNGEAAASCQLSDVLRALQQQKIILLSCHGKAEDTETGPSTTFDLAGDSGDTIGVKAEELVPQVVSSPLVILSACESGVYGVQWGEYPVGAAPLLIQRGAKRCIGSRFVLGAAFAQTFFPALGGLLAAGQRIEEAFVACLAKCETEGSDLWRDLACLELLGDA